MADNKQTNGAGILPARWSSSARTARRRHRPAGFTLLEILVVLVVLGLLMAGLSKGVQLGIQAMEHQSVALGERAELDAIDRTLRDIVTHIDPGSGRNPTRLDGKADHMQFQSRLPSAVALDTRRADMTLLIDERKRLVLRWKPARHETSIGDPVAPADTVLLDQVEKLEIAYWSPEDGSGQTPGWRDEWQAPYLPFIIRVRLTFPEGDRRRWPEMLASPLLEAPGG